MQEGDSPSITIYFDDTNLILPNDVVTSLESHLKRDIGVGCGFINIYTQDATIAQSAINWLEKLQYSVNAVVGAL